MSKIKLNLPPDMPDFVTDPQHVEKMAAVLFESIIKAKENFLMGLLAPLVGDRNVAVQDAKNITIVKHPAKIGQPTIESVFYMGYMIGMMIVEVDANGQPGISFHAKVVEYEDHEGKNVAVIYRAKQTAQTFPCPFCGASHKHNIQDGHRQARCKQYWVKGRGVVNPAESRVATDGAVLFREDGYIVRTFEITNPNDTFSEKN